jgi:hypothetical protein
MAYSSDGVTWTAAADNPLYYPYKYGDAGYDSTAFTDAIIKGIAWGNGKFAAVCFGGKTAVSSDGSTWTVAADKVFDDHNSIQAIAWGNGKFVAADSSVRTAYWDGN